MKFEQLAHGQRCYMGFPGVCCGDPAKVVPCHIRRGNVAGMGQKPPPVCLLPGCFNCHNAYDGRGSSPFTREQMDVMVLAGLNQWLKFLWDNEYLIGCVA